MGQRILLQGGICYNVAVVAAFREKFGDRLQVSPYFAISGALGAALLAMEKQEKKARTPKAEGKDFLQKYLREYRKALTVTEKLPGKKKGVVGIPFVLAVHRSLPFLNAFISHMGMEVLVSEGVQMNSFSNAASEELCFPMREVYAHLTWLMEQKVDYLVVPKMGRLREGNHPAFACVFMQSLGEMALALGKESGFEGKLFSMDLGAFPPEKGICDLVAPLCLHRERREMAYEAGLKAQKNFMQKTRAMYQSFPPAQKGEKTFVLMARSYNIQDERLNMGIIKNMEALGCRVITPAWLLPAEEMAGYPYGEHLIGAAREIRKRPDYFGVYLMNHGCAQDAMISHLIRQEMGGKPCLSLEVDGHFSEVGLQTRIEAFLQAVEQADHEEDQVQEQMKRAGEGLGQERPVYLPPMEPFASLLKNRLQKKQQNLHLLPEMAAPVTMRGIGQSKEYISFAFLGEILMRMQEEGRKGTVLYLASEGAEADAMYDKVLAPLCKDELCLHKIYPGNLWNTSFFTDIFLACLSGDILLSMEQGERKKMLGRWEKALPSAEELLDAARKVPIHPRRIGVTGEPFMLYQEQLHQNILTEVERRQFAVSHMPLSEWLCFQTEQQTEETSRCEAILQQIAEKTGAHGPFSPSLADLRKRASRVLPDTLGGYARYRAVKKQENLERFKADISLAPLYENTAAVLELISLVPAGSASLSLRLGEKGGQKAMEKLHAFLYCLEKRSNA